MKNLNLFISCAIIFCLSVCCGGSSGKVSPGVTFQFDLNRIAETVDITNDWVKSPVFGRRVLSVNVSDENNELVLTPTSEGIDWSSAKYLVCDVWHENPYSVLMHLQFFRKIGEPVASVQAEPCISGVIGILPCLRTQMVFPLSHLDGQKIFLTRQPRQMKGFVSGSRIDPSDVGKVSIRIAPDMSPDYLPNIQIASVYLTTELPKPLKKPTQPMVDSFGQWTAYDWPGKIHNSNELIASITQTETVAASATLPEQWSPYGGWKQLRFTPNGFFRTHHDGKRWWLVDPEGYAFISAGVDCIEAGSLGVVSGQEELFSWLPSENDTLFTMAYQRGITTQVDFMEVNLMRVYGQQWRQKWEEVTVGLMKHFRINTVGNWSDSDMARRNRLPYVMNMNHYPTTEVKLYRDFPDVFAPAYQQASQQFAKQLESVKDDPYLIGYFLQNEPHWGFGNNNLAFEMFATPTPSFTKRKMARWLQQKYGKIETFNKVWKQDLASFDDIESITIKNKPSNEVWDDCSEFSSLMVDRYVEIVCNEVKKVDPNHLNLGMRYSSISSELCYRAGAWFDVFSLNGYTNPAPPDTEEITRRSGKPVIIGEWHFGSIDRGLPATGIQGAESQTARGEAYRYYFEQGIARPELIGIHWFQWNDQPVFGRFDGENYNIGFMDICMRPYSELTDQIKISHERMYRVANGDETPFDKVIRKVTPICY